MHVGHLALLQRPATCFRQAQALPPTPPSSSVAHPHPHPASLQGTAANCLTVNGDDATRCAECKPNFTLNPITGQW